MNLNWRPLLFSHIRLRRRKPSSKNIWDSYQDFLITLFLSTFWNHKWCHLTKKKPILSVLRSSLRLPAPQEISSQPIPYCSPIQANVQRLTQLNHFHMPERSHVARRECYYLCHQCLTICQLCPWFRTFVGCNLEAVGKANHVFSVCLMTSLITNVCLLNHCSNTSWEARQLSKSQRWWRRRGLGHNCQGQVFEDDEQWWKSVTMKITKLLIVPKL